MIQAIQELKYKGYEKQKMLTCRLKDKYYSLGL